MPIEDPYDPRNLRPAVPIYTRPPVHRRPRGCWKPAAAALLVVAAALGSIFYGTYLVAAAVIS